MEGELISTLLRGFGLGLVLAIPLGPINLEIIRRGLTERPRVGYVLGLGACTVDLVYATLAGYGLAALLQSPMLVLACQGFGTVLLAWLGWGAFRGGLKQWKQEDETLVVQCEKVQGEILRRRLIASYLTGIAMTATSPYNILFWLTVPARFFAGQEITMALVLLTSASVLGGTFLWVTVLIGAVTYARKFVTGRRLALLSVAAGLGLMLFGIWTGVGAYRTLIGMLGQSS